MTQHSSLKSASVETRHRNVLKRHERVRNLLETDRWNDRQSVYKLPKLKLIKLKVKKAKGEKEGEAPKEGQAPVEGAAVPRTQVPAEASKKPPVEKTKGKEKA